eukprot:3306711-Rhodomonas_salina.1
MPPLCSWQQELECQDSEARNSEGKNSTTCACVPDSHRRKARGSPVTTVPGYWNSGPVPGYARYGYRIRDPGYPVPVYSGRVGVSVCVSVCVVLSGVFVCPCLSVRPNFHSRLGFWFCVYSWSWFGLGPEGAKAGGGGRGGSTAGALPFP